MRFFKILGVLLLLTVPCLLLAWGAMAIGQTGASVAGSDEAPASRSVPAVESAAIELPAASVAGSDEAPASRSVPAVQSTDDIAVVGDEQGAVDPTTSTVISFGTRRRAEADPLHGASDLSKAIAGQLQSGDQYLESQTRALAEQFAKAKDDEARAKLKGELAKTIERHFDVRHEIRKREIDQLEARVKKLREHLAKRGQSRQTIVQMRLGQFISAAEGLGWDADFGGGRSSSAQQTSRLLLQTLPRGHNVETNLEGLLEDVHEAVPEPTSENVPER